MQGAWRQIAGILVIALCLFNTGCSEITKNENFKNWQDLIRLLPEEEKTAAPVDKSVPAENIILGESVDIELYFVAADGVSLEAEKRTIPKTEGIARKTVEELVKGPGNKALSNPFPAGIELLDINIKPEGLCIVDLSSEAKLVDDQNQEQMMVYAIANTVGQFPSVKEVTFMVDGEKVEQLGGYLDLSIPIEPDYSI
ncbi:MAG TPA: GerMN domain-containing protein [Syntrophomonadaceae bacterium]|nr:GerMN domain-containing protein [Syntrophomonadaceae bacterium]HNX27896.1 GerMN domain-containing protein [Syntrophomonadaceae bacterium]HPR93172.1 GerMN domain-containing protein [Syntrophomonadaceae bacterium]